MECKNQTDDCPEDQDFLDFLQFLNGMEKTRTIGDVYYAFEKRDEFELLPPSFEEVWLSGNKYKVLSDIYNIDRDTFRGCFIYSREILEANYKPGEKIPNETIANHIWESLLEKEDTWSYGFHLAVVQFRRVYNP